MLAALMIRVGSEVLSASMGGFALFCLYYAAKLSDPDAVRLLCVEALEWGGAAAAIVYCQGRYLDR
jgi:hypothetical protein